MADPERRYDLMALRLDRPGAAEPALLDAGGGWLCTGRIKLIQRYLLELLTAAESMRLAPQRGCTFINDVRRGLRTPSDVLASFAFAQGAIAANLAAEESDADPLDERFASAEASGVAVLHGRIALTLTVRSLGGTADTVTLPIRTTPDL